MIVYRKMSGFRPLIRGFFFYLKKVVSLSLLLLMEFPSPHSGILFLFAIVINVIVQIWAGFRPLIRGFFFYFDDHFRTGIYHSFWFPSPHSGILFLYGQK